MPEEGPFLHYPSAGSPPSASAELLERLKERDDKVSLLEYELRRAREDITNLRSQLTSMVKKSQASLTSSPSLSIPASYSHSTSNTEGDDQTMTRLQRDSIREHEKKILNYLVKNYLVQNKYSLTAITFAEEVCKSPPPPFFFCNIFIIIVKDAGRVDYMGVCWTRHFRTTPLVVVV